MHGMRHEHGGCRGGGHWAAGRWGRGHRGYGAGGPGGRFARDGGGPRFARMIGSSDLQLIALALIAEQPRHGYEIIKVLEEKTDGAYSPSPGMVYPTLTYLEEADYVTAQAEGAKKLFSITDAGREHLAKNRDYADALLERLVAVGRKVAELRRRYDSEQREERATDLPPLVRAALDNIRDVTAKRFEDDPEAEAKIVEILARAAGELRKT